ncbi:hypothetical protein [Halorubrum sp. Boch-26]|uniref:hypothetical protein n=1 Tax=Halorubrum sp. Boch-26 TaxID=2994426 RepID=UPI002468A7BB|nr:hypothetical protein [Halorubrum sp. Boch-26]
MSRRVEVELRVESHVFREEVDVSVVATDDAAVDIARRQAGIAPEAFETGEVVP